MRCESRNLRITCDAAGVERAVVVCASVGDNPGNADYAFAAARAHPGRFVVFPDIVLFLPGMMR